VLDPGKGACADPGKGACADPGKGACADPVNGGAILGKGGRILIAGTGSVSWLRTKGEERRDT
jgi:hypothetical protein